MVKRRERSGAVAAGIAQAYAEEGKRVLLVDYDPQGHLSEQLGIPQIGPDHDSLVSHMCGEGQGDLRDLVVVIDARTVPTLRAGRVIAFRELLRHAGALGWTLLMLPVHRHRCCDPSSAHA